METKHRNNTIEVESNRFRFDVDVYIFREEEHMTAYCPSLDLASRRGAVFFCNLHNNQTLVEL